MSYVLKTGICEWAKNTLRKQTYLFTGGGICLVIFLEDVMQKKKKKSSGGRWRPAGDAIVYVCLGTRCDFGACLHGKINFPS